MLRLTPHLSLFFMSFSKPTVLVFKKKKKKVRANSNNKRDKTLERERETQKNCELLNKRHYFTIYYQNKRPETNKTFERERKRNLRGYHLRYTDLPPPSRHQNPYG